MELYARARRAVQVEGKSERQVARGVWAGAGDRSKDVAVFSVAAVTQAFQFRKIGTVLSCSQHVIENCSCEGHRRVSRQQE